jgi:hypothetical protein
MKKITLQSKRSIGVMPGRGGWREGAGRKSAWEHGETKTIRVPVALKDSILEIGRDLDQGQEIYRGKTCIQIKQLVKRWEERSQDEDSLEWKYAKEILAELKDILSRKEERQKRCQKKQHQHQNQLKKGGESKTF